jgi:hypothetical protein
MHLNGEGHYYERILGRDLFIFWLPGLKSADIAQHVAGEDQDLIYSWLQSRALQCPRRDWRGT